MFAFGADAGRQLARRQENRSGRPVVVPALARPRGPAPSRVADTGGPAPSRVAGTGGPAPTSESMVASREPTEPERRVCRFPSHSARTSLIGRIAAAGLGIVTGSTARAAGPVTRARGATMITPPGPFAPSVASPVPPQRDEVLQRSSVVGGHLLARPRGDATERPRSAMEMTGAAICSVGARAGRAAELWSPPGPGPEIASRITWPQRERHQP